MKVLELPFFILDLNFIGMLLATLFVMAFTIIVYGYMVMDQSVISARSRTNHTVTLFVIGLIATGGIFYMSFDALTLEKSTVTIGTGGTTILSTANVQMEVSWDTFGNNPVESIVWGEIEMDQSTVSLDRIFYIRNVGNKPFTLTLMSQNYVPTDFQTGVTLSLSNIEQSVSPGRVRKVTLTFVIDRAQIPTGEYDFSFDIVIIATEYQ